MTVARRKPFFYVPSSSFTQSFRLCGHSGTLTPPAIIHSCFCDCRIPLRRTKRNCSTQAQADVDTQYKLLERPRPSPKPIDTEPITQRRPIKSDRSKPSQPRTRRFRDTEVGPESRQSTSRSPADEHLPAAGRSPNTGKLPESGLHSPGEAEQDAQLAEDCTGSLEEIGEDQKEPETGNHNEIQIDALSDISQHGDQHKEIELANQPSQMGLDIKSPLPLEEMQPGPQSRGISTPKEERPAHGNISDGLHGSSASQSPTEMQVKAPLQDVPAAQKLPLDIQGPPQRKPLPARRPSIGMFRRDNSRHGQADPQTSAMQNPRPDPGQDSLSKASMLHRSENNIKHAESSDEEFTDSDELTTDAEDILEKPMLNAKPVMQRPAPPKRHQPKPWKDATRASERLPPERRTNEFQRLPSALERRQEPTARKQQAQPSNGSTVRLDSERPGIQGRPRDSGRRKPSHEKQDIERQRASRQERRQQRQEQLKAHAREQEEIFEVGSEGMSVGELADRLAVNGGDILKVLFLKGIMAHVNQVLDKEMVKVVAEEYDVEVLDLEEEGLDTMARKTPEYANDDDRNLLAPRPPVVTVMGHVDHGKTSLLDYVRKTKVAAGEAGGITQAIGAYTVEVDTKEDGPKQITFLDTPGHEAFSAMRARGAKVTDIAIIMVACDDGVRPQTKEAINHAKAAGVPIIVALNKIDKEGANEEKAKQEMNEAGLLPEEWGGETPFVPISAKKGLGIDALLETILLVAEVAELTANPTRRARGSVIEAHLDRRMGPVASLLVATGTLRLGDAIVAGACYGKVRSMTDSLRRQCEEAGPSIAVQLVGLNNVPVAGDDFAALETEQEARKLAVLMEDSQRNSRLAEQAGGSMVTGMTLATYDEETEALQYLNLILKADASGSVEAIKAALLALPQDRIALRFLTSAAGEINSNDIQLANTSEGHVLGFNLELSEAVQAQAKQYGVHVQSHKVIYELIDGVRYLMEDRLGVAEEQIPIGHAEVRAVFGSGSKKVAGCIVTQGNLIKGCLVSVTRREQILHKGTVVSLRRGKDNVTEVSNGNECGLAVDDFMDWREGDKIDAFEVRATRQTLEEASQSSKPQANESRQKAMH